MSVASGTATWTRQTAEVCPLMKYLRGLGPVGTIVNVTAAKAARDLGFRSPMVFANEMRDMKFLGLVAYTCDNSGEPWSIRVLE